MTTARDTIRGALRLIRVIDSTEDVQAEDAADGLKTLNEMVHGWKNNGIFVDYQDIELGDEIPFPPRDHRNIRYLLAADLAAEFGTELTPEVATQARESFQMLQAHYGVQPEARPDLSITNRLSRYGNVYNIKSDSV